MQKCSIDILHKIFVSGFFAAMKQTGGYLVYDFPFIWQKSHIHEISKNVHRYPYVFQAYSFSSGLKNDKQTLGDST